MAEPLFALNDVYYSHPGDIPGLCGLSLSIGKGELAAVIGANGTGKSTLLALLDALVFAQKGTLRAFGRDVDGRAMRDAGFQRFFRSKVGFVFQNPDIQLFCPTVREDVLFGPLQLGLPRETIAARLDEVARQLRLEALLERPPHRLSIGEKRKAAIASVLMMEPEVLLLDEPTSGLDPQTTRDIIEVIRDCHRKGATVVMATHDLHIVEEIAQVVHVFGGNRAIVRSGPVEMVLTDQEFLQRHNLAHIHVHRHLHLHHSHPH